MHPAQRPNRDELPKEKRYAYCFGDGSSISFCESYRDLQVKAECIKDGKRYEAFYSGAIPGIIALGKIEVSSAAVAHKPLAEKPLLLPGHTEAENTLASMQYPEYVRTEDAKFIVSTTIDPVDLKAMLEKEFYNPDWPFNQALGL